jgi:ATP-binding cassette subfamily F protein 3
MLSEANFLILDEPTNHLDITSKEILENALNAYTGTVLYVSHDRYFINKTASRILELDHHTFTGYLGNYEYYLEKKNELNTAASDSSAQEKVIETASESKLDWKAKKELQAAERKKQNDLKKCEEKIEKLEQRNNEITELMSAPEICTDVAKLQELNKEKEENDSTLSALYEQWEALSE